MWPGECPNCVLRAFTDSVTGCFGWSAYLALLAAPLLRTDLTVVPLGPFVARTNAKKEEPLFRLVERMTKQPA